MPSPERTSIAGSPTSPRGWTPPSPWAWRVRAGWLGGGRSRCSSCSSRGWRLCRSLLRGAGCENERRRPISWAHRAEGEASVASFRRGWSPSGRSDPWLQLGTTAEHSGGRALPSGHDEGLPFAPDGRPRRRRMNECRVFVQVLMQYRCLVSQSLRAFRDDRVASALLLRGVRLAPLRLTDQRRKIDPAPGRRGGSA